MEWESSAKAALTQQYETFMETIISDMGKINSQIISFNRKAFGRALQDEESIQAKMMEERRREEEQQAAKRARLEQARSALARGLGKDMFTPKRTAEDMSVSARLGSSSESSEESRKKKPTPFESPLSHQSRRN